MTDFDAIKNGVSLLHDCLYDMISKNNYDVSVIDRGDDSSKHYVLYEKLIDSCLSKFYGALKSKRSIKNPPKAITKFFFEFDKEYAKLKIQDRNVYHLICLRNMDTEKQIYNFSNNIFSELSKDQLKMILFKREILRKKP